VASQIFLNLSGLLVQVNGLLWSEHIDTHVGADGVVRDQVRLVPGVQFESVMPITSAVVLGRLFEPEEELFFIGTEAPLDHGIVVRRALMNVEVLQLQVGDAADGSGTLGVEPLLELQPVVRCRFGIIRLHILERKGKLLVGDAEDGSGVIERQEGSAFVQLGQDQPHFVAGVDVHRGIQVVPTCRDRAARRVPA